MLRLVGLACFGAAAAHALTSSLRPPARPLQIATVLALEKQGPAALEGMEAAHAATVEAADAAGGLITIPTAYRR